MKTFYKWLLSIGIAIGVFCSLIVFSALLNIWTSAILGDKIHESNVCKIVMTQESRTNKGMGFDYVQQIQNILPKTIISDYSTMMMHPVEVSYNSEPIQGISYDNEPLPNTVFGTGSNYQRIMKLKLIQGRYISSEDIDNCEKVCVVSSYFYDLIKTRDATHVDINGEAYKIIGIISEEEGYGLISGGDIFLPLTTLIKDSGHMDVSSGIIDRIIFDKGDFSIAQIRDILKAKANEAGVDVSDLKIMPYQQNEYINTNEVVKQSMIIFLISLLVLIIAALNIIHIATASIIDREREIGLRTALGASTRHIIMQVSGEILICVLKGGIAGIALVSIIIAKINYSFYYNILHFNIMTVIAGVLLTLAAGLITSIVPARKAAMLNPAIALREE